MNYISIMIGGAVGALLRYAISSGIYSLTSSDFPWGTLIVNLLGSFMIGLFWQLFNTYTIPPHIRSMLFAGGLGAFTTFSTYSLETVLLLQNGQIKLGLMNTVFSATLGIIAVWLGMTAVRYFIPAQQ